MRLIDADKQKNQIAAFIVGYGGSEKRAAALCRLIDLQPTVEAVPVVHGKWTHTGYCGEWECSHCKNQIALSDDENGHPNFCPNCGADMRKKVFE